ncbi:hypothetical protein T265_06457 [Opisthorchis viverrini]|uniref:Uncharacterized protein n=1 Tax=Opisthorchis viverrini TaxID=6198 RepID=A0A074ZKH4_OPIVI|nr:hypothetical protein T265_06457 [Opisthorchis viverrini]KER26262.1 hypothetical protein T265_06457 [Opisthorchis viverrini]
MVILRRAVAYHPAPRQPVEVLRTLVEKHVPMSSYIVVQPINVKEQFLFTKYSEFQLNLSKQQNTQRTRYWLYPMRLNDGLGLLDLAIALNERIHDTLQSLFQNSDSPLAEALYLIGPAPDVNRRHLTILEKLYKHKPEYLEIS